MRKNAFIPADHIAALNTVKSALVIKNMPFTKETLLEGLRNCGIPANSIFWNVLNSENIIARVSKNTFAFTSKEPIHVSVLARLYKKYQEIKKKYYTKSQKQEKPIEKDLIQEAIKLLKANGYKIYSVVTSLKEV